MKTHFLALFNIENRKKTLTFLISSIILIIASIIVGINDNPLGIAMIGIGIICFYYSFLHTWNKAGNFVRLIYLSLGLMLLLLLVIITFASLHKTEYLSEGLLMGIFLLICIPLILIGLFGAFTRPNNTTWKWSMVVGIILLAIGIIVSPLLFIHNYKMNHSVVWSLFIVLVICFPFILAGILFIWRHNKKIKHLEPNT
ncbi:MAG: hypothetical protein WCK18_04420 [Prolixibacteraceae bacterium]